MSTQAKFFFTGNSDQFTKALSQVKKSMKQVATQTVVLQAGLKLLSATVNAVAKTLTTVLGAAIKGIVNLVKGALNTIKALVTGAFKFIKTALTTLLSWITKALGKVFDWIGNMFNSMTKVAAKTVNLAKKTVKQISQSIQAFADKEYNQIQLKVSLGDSYDSVMKDFRQLVKYTTADRNDLLSVYATFAELGKKPEDVVKYAKATVYLSNATGRSLSQITRLLLGQEAAGRDLEKVLGRIGISLSGQEESVSNVEKIINQLDDEMNALATGSLNQLFANIKNDVIAIKENLGQLFSGPVRYVAQKIEELLDRVVGSNKIQGLADKLNQAFDSIKPYIDKVFNFLEKIVQDPAGFLNALWSDLKTLWNNLTTNFNKYLNIFGYILGEGIREVIDAIGKIDWSEVSLSFSNLASALSNFTISIGLGAGWFEAQDVVENSFKQTFINAWNRAHETFQLSDSDPWYKNLWTMIQGIWTDLDLSKKLSDAWDGFLKVWNDQILPTLVYSFQVLGEVLGTAINNAIASSETIRKVLNVIPGVNFATQSDYSAAQNRIYNENKAVFDARGLSASDITPALLSSTYGWIQHGKNGKMGTWADYLNDITRYGDDVKTLQATVLAMKDYPTVDEILDGIKKIWSGSTTKPTGSLLEDVPHYAKGGIVTEPTLALIGEGGGKEYIIPEEAIPNGSKSFNWRNPFSSAASALGYENVVVFDFGESAIKKWADSTEVVTENSVDYELKIILPLYKRIWNAVKNIGSVIGKYVGGTVGLLAQNGAFGTHLGNIYSGSFDENGSFSILKMFGAIIQEFLPYLQKGLSLIGTLFDQAFDILGNAVSILGERLGKVILPLLESFIPLMKTIADIVIALAPVVESVIAPAIKVIAVILQVLTGVLDALMPVFAGLASVIQWVSDAISYAIGSVINWLASWIPWISRTEVHKPKSIGDYYWDIMDTYNASKANPVGTSITSSAGTASQTASYNGAMTVHITNDFSGAYVVGNNGFRELALIIKNTLEDVEYSGQSV